MSEFFFSEVMLLKSDTIADSGTLPLSPTCKVLGRSTFYFNPMSNCKVPPGTSQVHGPLD